MKRAILHVSLALVAICLLAVGVAYARPAGASSFLSEYAESPQQVVDQTEANRLIALRYARVFVAEPKAVLAYFRNELTVVTLTESIDVKEYHLDDSGRIVSAPKTLKAGTTVFANKAGYPVLEYGTGNPLASELPTGRPLTQANNSSQQGVQGTQATSQTPPKPTVTNVASNVANPDGTPVPPAPTQPVVPTTPGSTVIPTPGANPPVPPVDPTTAVAGVQMSTGGGGLGGWLLPAAGLAGAVVALSGHGGSTDEPTPPPVPEPTSCMALGAGLLMLGGVIRRRRRRS